MRLRLGASACLLGETVRYDGSHKRDRIVTETLGDVVEWVPVCPEVELGLGIPREPIQLEGDPRAPRLVAIRTRTDHTRVMARFARARVEVLATQDLAGYVLKRNSPSCGLARVPVHRRQGPATLRGVGLFARVLTERLPLLPVEDEARLADPTRRENFVERLVAYARWKELVATRPTRAKLVGFHGAHELQLLAHDSAAHRRLGRLVTRPGRPLRATLAQYGQLFMAALAVVATRHGHARALAVVLARLSPHLDDDGRNALRAAIAAYRRGRAPLAVPLALARDHARRLAVDGVAEQTYLAEPRVPDR